MNRIKERKVEKDIIKEGASGAWSLEGNFEANFSYCYEKLAKGRCLGGLTSLGPIGARLFEWKLLKG